MKKAIKSGRSADVGVDDILPEYDFSRARPNKYASRYRKGSLVVTLDPEVAAVFSSAAEANDALRSLARIITAQRQRPSRKTRAHDPPVQPTGSARG